MGLADLHRASDKARDRSSGTKERLRWSYKGQPIDTVRWVLSQSGGQFSECSEPSSSSSLEEQSLMAYDVVTRAVVDVSNILYPPFVRYDQGQAAQLRRDLKPLRQITLERRFKELNTLNVFVDQLKRDFPDLEEIVLVYDHPSDRRLTKVIAEKPRMLRAARLEASKEVRRKIQEYHAERNKDPRAHPSIPQIDFDKNEDWFGFAPFSPPTDEEINSLQADDLPEIEREIQVEATKLAEFCTTIVSTSEADSVCRNASLGLYTPTADLPVHHYRAARTGLTRVALPSHSRLSVIIASDSDHLFLNDPGSAAFVVGYSESNLCRATDLRRRQSHPEDWKYLNRRSQTFAAALFGCDETLGLQGFTTSGVAYSNRSVTRVPTHLAHERDLLCFINEFDQLLAIWKNATQTGVKQPSSLFSKPPHLVDHDDLEREFQSFLSPMLKEKEVEKQIPDRRVTLKSTMEVTLGLLEEQGGLARKKEWRRKVEEPIQLHVNKELGSIFSQHGYHNHPFSSLVKAPSSTRTSAPSPPNRKHLPYRLVQGPESAQFLVDQEEESRKLVERQATESSRDEDRRSSPQARKTESRYRKTEGQVIAVKKKKRAPPVGPGFKEFQFSMSTIKFPFRISTIRDIAFDGLYKDHRFHYDLIAVLGSILRVWLNECPSIVEILSGIFAFYWEFAPSLLSEWSSKPQRFGDLASAVVIALGHYYDAYPTQADQKFSDPTLELDPSVESRVSDFEDYVPPDRKQKLRERIRDSRFVGEEIKLLLGKNQLLDIAAAVVIKERLRLSYPPPLLRDQKMIMLNMTTCGTGFQNASHSRSKTFPSFLASNLPPSLLDLPSRLLPNPYNLDVNPLDRARSLLDRCDPAAIAELLPSTTSRGVVRLVKLRIHLASLPDSTSVSSRRPRKKPVEADSPQDDAGDSSQINLEEAEEEERDDESEREEEEEEEDFDDLVRDDIGIPERFKDKLKRVMLTATVRRPDAPASNVIDSSIENLVSYIVACIDFLLDFIGRSYLEALANLSPTALKKWKKYRTIGEFVVAVGGKDPSLRKNEGFLEGDSKEVGEENEGAGEGEQEVEEEQSEEAEGEEGEEEKETRAGAAKAVMRQIVLETLPFLGKPFFRFKPRGCTINVPILQSLTSNDSRAERLPATTYRLLERTATESRLFNASCVAAGVQIESLKPEGLPSTDPRVTAYELLEKLSVNDPFIADQLAHPDKIISWVNNHWPHLEFVEEPSPGPLIIRVPNESTLSRLQAQSATVNRLFSDFHLTQDDTSQVQHELLN
ncbi:uncharacterized protein JCM6883_007502 [Sporobolomyces salmoneus]|uniref:uncharacterized protein n=1 Tax=Sporobolomyces salmoneus TaxID=183962 RepID=UPI00316EA341